MKSLSTLISFQRSRTATLSARRSRSAEPSQRAKLWTPAIELTLRAAALCFAWMAKSPKASALFDTRVIHCGDNLDQLRKLPNSARNSQPLPQG